LHLAPFYPHPGNSVSIDLAWAAAFLLTVVTALVVGFGRRLPYLPVGWFWYIGTLVPVIGLVQTGGQALADRYTYVPLIGLFLMLTWLVSDALSAGGYILRVAGPAFAGVALFACAALS